MAALLAKLVNVLADGAQRMIEKPILFTYSWINFNGANKIASKSSLVCCSLAVQQPQHSLVDP